MGDEEEDNGKEEGSRQNGETSQSTSPEQTGESKCTDAEDKDTKTSTSQSRSLKEDEDKDNGSEESDDDDL